MLDRFEPRNGALIGFDSVKCRYDRTKPVISKYHTRADDIRPIGARYRKWENIEKVNDKKYILHDYRLSNLNNTQTGKAHDAYFRSFQERPPIVWERKTVEGADVDVVTVRGAPNKNLNISRHNFLRCFLPLGLYWHTGLNGIHKVLTFVNAPVTTGADVKAYYLPKVKQDGADYFLSFLKPATHPYQSHSEWQLCSAEWPIPRKRVNKKLKSALKKDYEQFWEWMCSVAPLLDFTDSSRYQDLRMSLKEYLNEHPVSDPNSSTMAYRWGLQFPKLLAIEVITNYDHSLRVHLAANFLINNNIKVIATKEDRQRFRASYNNWVNKTLGLIEEVV